MSAADRHADAGAATGAQVLSIARWVDIGRELGGAQDLSNHQALDVREVLTHHAHERTIRVAHVVDACFVQVQEAVVTSRVRDHQPCFAIAIVFDPPWPAEREVRRSLGGRTERESTHEQLQQVRAAHSHTS